MVRAAPPPHTVAKAEKLAMMLPVAMDEAAYTNIDSPGTTMLRCRHSILQRQPLPMPIPPASTKPAKSRERTAATVLHIMTRFPLIVEILDGLTKATVPCPGDQDIRHGCDRAVTAILTDLARIEPAPSGMPSKAEDAVRLMLSGDAGVGTINADLLERIHQFIARIFGQQIRAAGSERQSRP